MKFFQSARNSFAMLGICPDQSHQKNPFNAKILTGYLYHWVGMGIFLTCMFCSQNAQNFEEYLYVFNYICAELAVVACYSIFVLEMGRFIEILDTCKKIINESKCKFKWIYDDMSISTIFIHLCVWYDNLSLAMIFKTVLGLKYSASKIFYVKIGPITKKWNKFLHIGYIKVIFPAVFLLIILVSAFKYLTMNSGGNDALQLPLPMW